MLDFLATLLKSAPTLQSLFSGENSAPYLKEQRANAERQNQLTDALTNTQNPIFQNLYGQFEQQGNQDVARVLAEAQGQNRASASLGRVPLLSQERGGEQLFRALMEGKQKSSNSASEMARGNIQAALQGGNATANAYDNLSGYGKAKNAARDAAYGGIGDLLGGNQMQIPSFETGGMSGFDDMAKLMKMLKGQSVFGVDGTINEFPENAQKSLFPSIRGIFNG